MCRHLQTQLQLTRWSYRSRGGQTDLVKIWKYLLIKSSPNDAKFRTSPDLNSPGSPRTHSSIALTGAIICVLMAF